MEEKIKKEKCNCGCESHENDHKHIENESKCKCDSSRSCHHDHNENSCNDDNNENSCNDDNNELSAPNKPKRHAHACSCCGDEDEEENTKLKIVRILTTLAAFIAAFVVYKVVPNLMPWYGFLAVFAVLYLWIAYDVLWRAIKNIAHGKIFDENFLMTIATLGAFFIKEFPEAVAVLLFYQIGEFFQDYAVDKTRKSISSLMNIRPEKAVIVVNGEEKEVAPEQVAIGDIVVVRAGEKISVDGVVTEGQSSLDTAALTGESMPRNAKVGDFVLSGSINLSGVIYIKAEKTYADSTVSKILELVEHASDKKAKTENFISRFAKYYTPAVVLGAVLLAVIPSLFDGNWLGWLTRALTFLVVSCPCALVISVPLSFFGGIGGASKKGVLIKGSNYLELINKANVFVFDKTGTLTEGRFAVRTVSPESDKEKILNTASVAESFSNHPIAKCIVSAANDYSEDGFNIEEIAGKGIKATNGERIILCGNYSLMSENGIACEKVSAFGSVIYVADSGLFLGTIIVADEIKQDAASTISELKKSGIKTVMLTGDNKETAEIVASRIGIDEFKAGLLPGDKVGEVEKIIDENKGGAVVFVGDGINDAPVLMRADIGISMGGVGSDSAVEASDIVLMHDKLSGIGAVKKIAKKTVRIVKENIVFALIIKFAVLAMSIFGTAAFVATYGMWLAVVADVGVSFIAILNAIRAMITK